MQYVPTPSGLACTSKTKANSSGHDLRLEVGLDTLVWLDLEYVLFGSTYIFDQNNGSSVVPPVRPFPSASFSGGIVLRATKRMRVLFKT